MADRDSILKAIGSRKPVKLKVDEWGKDIYLKPLTVGEWIAAEEGDNDALTGFRLVAKAVTDKDGNQLLNVDDLMAMPADQSVPILRIIAKVRSMRMGQADVKKK